jgi:hypothetical protein
MSLNSPVNTRRSTMSTSLYRRPFVMKALSRGPRRAVDMNGESELHSIAFGYGDEILEFKRSIGVGLDHES